MLEPNFYTKKVDLTGNYGKFIFEPLPLSFGQSLGHALRRTLLSSIKGAVITNVKFDGVAHMFSTIEGVKESVLEIILNLKRLRFLPQGAGPFRVYLKANKAGKIYGKDLEGEVLPTNKDCYIAEITDKKGKIDLEAIVEVGFGWSLVEDRENKIPGFIPLDAFFSPIEKVNFKVEETRVGRKSNFERLILEIWTNGTIKPEEALLQSTKLLSSYFAYILSGNDAPKKEEKEALKKEEDFHIDNRFSEVIVDELNLPSRVVNALLKEKVETVADLIKLGKERLNRIKGLGKKSIDLVEGELKRLGVDFK